MNVTFQCHVNYTLCEYYVNSKTEKLCFSIAAEDPCWWSEEELAAIRGTRLGYLALQYQASLPVLTAFRNRLLDICR